MLPESKKISKVFLKNKDKVLVKSEKRKTTKQALLEENALLKKKLDFVQDSLNQIVNGNNFCPVNLDSYNLKDNLPFHLHCGHNLSLQSLYQMKSQKKKIGKAQTKIMQCPLCKKDFLFAVLDQNFLKILNLSKTMELDEIDQNDFQKEQEEMNKVIKSFPKVFGVRGGIFSAFTG